MMPGDRVRISIDNRERWNASAADALHGQVGTVEEIRAYGNTLVTFDAPIPSPWKWGSPITAFWFDRDEVKPLETP